MKKWLKLLAAVMCFLILAGCGTQADSTQETTPTQIPETQIPETVPADVVITGGEEDLVLVWNTETVILTHNAQMESLMAQGEALPHLAEISLEGEVPAAAQILALTECFPQVQIHYSQVEILGGIYDYGTTAMELLELTEDEAALLASELAVLPELAEIRLCREGEVSAVSLDAAAILSQAHPHIIYHYAVELFGQILSTDMERVEYFKVAIGDDGLAQLQKLLPMMHNLTYFRLDWCETSDEAMAQLRDTYADRFKVVWRVFFGKYNCLTDTYKIWANGITTEESYVLRYCTEVKYMDIGHSEDLANVDFVSFMPDLEVVIIGDCKSLDSIEPLRNCRKLEYLEVFTTSVSDLSPLSELTSLEHLNISGTLVTDLSPLDGLCNLKRLWSNRNDHLEDQVLRFKELYPDCKILTRGGHPIHYQWRYKDPDKISKVPRYALLRRQIGYETNDYSCYPRGYLREEITYESTGIDPEA